MTATGGTILASLTAAELAMRPFTVVRSRILVGVTSDQAAVSENQVAGFGIAVVSDQANAIGVTAVPTPITDQGSDLFYSWTPLLASFAFITGAGFDAQFQTNYVVDSKAMRKVNEGQDMVQVVEGEFVLGSGTTITTMGLQLIKLH